MVFLNFLLISSYMMSMPCKFNNFKRKVIFSDKVCSVKSIKMPTKFTLWMQFGVYLSFYLWTAKLFNNRQNFKKLLNKLKLTKI